MICQRKIIICVFVLSLLTISIRQGAKAEMTETSVKLPGTVGVWNLSGSPQIFDSKNIFDYMNGGGELYLAYRFDHLQVDRYTGPDKTEITVEIYFMEDPDDAFGLLSLDWGGDMLDFQSGFENHKTSSIAPKTRALYGGGLLRLCAGSVYARILAFPETPASKDAVLKIGKAISSGKDPNPEPSWLKTVPETINNDWKLMRHRLAYFHSHLVLNSQYYLSHKNILKLDHSTEAVFASFESEKQDGTKIRFKTLNIQYDSPEKAEAALDSFVNAYIPEQEFRTGNKIKDQGSFDVEDGWMGYHMKKTSLLLVFECPDQKLVKKILENFRYPVENKEKFNEK